jgi:hypothetical protein
MLKTWLAHPLTRGLNIDDPHTTHVRLRIIQEKKFLRQIYQEWYRALVASLPSCEGSVLELGAGAGFLAEYIPDLIASEIVYAPNIKVVTDGMRLPFTAASLRVIVMPEVLHHLAEQTTFFLRRLHAVCAQAVWYQSMIEPWVSNWSHFIYTHLHHEPFQTRQPFMGVSQQWTS